MSDHSGRGGIYEGPDGTPLYGDGREVDPVDTSKLRDKSDATIHGTESGDATFCKNCGKPIVEDTSGRGWRHGETGPYVCSETYAQPGGAPPESHTVTLDRIDHAFESAISALAWLPQDGPIRKRTAEVVDELRAARQELARFRAAERQK